MQDLNCCLFTYEYKQGAGKVLVACAANVSEQAKGYRVGPVYDDVLSMAWVFLELLVKSMALEQARAFVDHQLSGRLERFNRADHACDVQKFLLHTRI